MEIISMEENNNRKWFYPGVQFSHKGIEEFRFYSFIIINRIFRPIIREKLTDIKYDHWRFHSRSDGTDANVKIIIYTDATNWDKLIRLDDKKLNGLPEDFPLKIAFTDCKDQGETERSKEIGGSSTPDWPKPSQDTFPSYIQGVCECYISLIEQIDATIIYAQVKSVWINYGWHAFYHHLGAIFQYEPTLFQGQFLVNL